MNIKNTLILIYFLKKHIPIKDIKDATYLCDWKHALDYDEVITGVVWESSPFNNPNNEIINELIDCEYKCNECLNADILKSANHVLNVYKNTKNFRTLVLSTYPLFNNHIYEQFDLITMAKQYKERTVLMNKIDKI